MAEENKTATTTMNTVLGKIWRPSNAELGTCTGCAWCDGKVPDKACGPCHFCTAIAHGASDLNWVDAHAFKTDPMQALATKGFANDRVRLCWTCQYEAEMRATPPAGTLCTYCVDINSSQNNNSPAIVASWYTYSFGRLVPTCMQHTHPSPRPLACIYWAHHSKTTTIRPDKSTDLYCECNCPSPSCAAYGKAGFQKLVLKPKKP
jgi:hypothetical protein